MEEPMKKIEFIEKYFTDNFYWVNENNFKELQEIAIEFGCVNPSGQKDIIDFHDGFNNLGIRTKNGVTKFQKECFLVSGRIATNYDEMISNYNKIFIKTN